MYVVDRRFPTLVAYVAGSDAATGGQLLEGFREWLHERRREGGETSLTWDAQLLHARYPGRTRDELAEDEGSKLVDDLFEALDQFLAARRHVVTVNWLST